MKKNIIHKKKGVTGFDYILVLYFIIMIAITVYPFLNVLAISFNEPIDTMRNVNFIIPRKFTMYNFKYVFTQNKLFTPFLMSIARTVIGTVTGIICTAMVAYVLSRKDFCLNKLFTVIFILTMYVSGGLIPEYLLITRTLHMSGKFIVYIIPGLIGVFYIILIRAYIEGIPVSLQEAAQIDGANDLIVWLKIILPLCKPVLATVALFIAVGQWNSFMDTYLYARDLSTLQYELFKIMESARIHVNPNAANMEEVSRTISPLSVRMAITIIATVPILVVYPFLQKYFVGGITLGAVKD